ncbi:transient receptor potential cation channel protein painless-like [Diorhabda carinulata]|uniref:transient receptor potential cation channel protein painless-like n=1 Tax=Diorhabda carinulata TaxID=1163345 RepID=UPI0025A1D742|nr:transient receptor potential cation channel protein painless-like [Diorhabda carinulata]
MAYVLEMVNVLENRPLLNQISTENDKSPTDLTTKFLNIIRYEPEPTARELNEICSEVKSKLGTIDCIDEDWYGWEPIHFVARNCNVENLQVILDYIDDRAVNSLTYFSENALHVLLQYEKSVTPFSASLHNGSESKAIAILGPENPAIEQCAKLLIERGIDVNHTNCWNETPLSLAIRYRYIKLINFLLTIDYLDLDSFKECGKPLRQYLKWNLYINLPQSYVEEEDISTMRFNLLKSGDEESFMSYKIESISDSVNCFDGNDAYNSSGTMLQLCMIKGYLEFIQDKHSNVKKLINYDIKDTPLLTIFKAKGMSRCIIFLLDNGADPSITSRKFPKTLLEYSAIRGYYPFVAILLYHKNSKINSNEIFSILSKVSSILLDVENISKAFYIKCVIYLLLNKLVILNRYNKERLTHKKLEVLNKILHQLNLENDDLQMDDSEMICLILHLGASLTACDPKADRNDYHKMIVQRLDQNILKSHFDDCIQGTRFIYDSIIQDDNKVYDENRTLNFLVKDSSKRKLLVHPLIIELTRQKWAKMCRFFYVDMLLYTMFLLSIYVYMIYTHFNQSSFYINSVFYLLLIIHFGKETMQLLLLYGSKYFYETSNNLEVTTIFCCIITILYPNIYTSVLSILVGTLIFFIMLGQLPFFSKYTIIFSSIRYFFQYTGFYFIQFVSFALSFYIVFPFPDSSDNPKWGDIFKSLFYTLIQFTGEFNDRVLEPTEYPVFGRITMTVFIFCMTIILNNLLVSLMVSDMDNIQKRGRLYKQVKLTSFIESTSRFVKRLHDFKYLNFIKNILKHVNIFRKGHEKVFINVNIAKFKDENKEYLEDIKKREVFDTNVLKDVYTILLK